MKHRKFAAAETDDEYNHATDLPKDKVFQDLVDDYVLARDDWRAAPNEYRARAFAEMERQWIRLHRYVEFCKQEQPAVVNQLSPAPGRSTTGYGLTEGVPAADTGSDT